MKPPRRRRRRKTTTKRGRTVDVCGHSCAGCGSVLLAGGAGDRAGGGGDVASAPLPPLPPLLLLLLLLLLLARRGAGAAAARFLPLPPSVIAVEVVVDDKEAGVGADAGEEFEGQVGAGSGLGDGEVSRYRSSIPRGPRLHRMTGRRARRKVRNREFIHYFAVSP